MNVIPSKFCRNQLIMDQLASVFRLLLGVVLLASYVCSIRVSSLIVPHQVGRGQDVRMHCHFSLGGHKLYSVKWFKGSHEFFRVVPEASRPVRVFPLPELTVETLQSNVSSVLLKNVQRTNTGTYRCEVSGEAPHFETDYQEANMSVIDLPVQGPIIVNVQTSYQPGERVSLNCTSAPSKPMALLQWYIDGKLAPNPYVKRYVDGSFLLPTGRSSSSSFSLHQRQQQQQHLHVKKEEEGWQNVGSHHDATDQPDQSFGRDDWSATVGLEFIADLPSTPPYGVFAVRNATCIATVGDIYRSATHVHLRIVDNRYSSAMASDGAKRSSSSSSTIRPPSHLQSNGAEATNFKSIWRGCWESRNSDVNYTIGVFIIATLASAIHSVLC